MTAPDPVLAIGLMSGTSMDGIDVALLRTDGRAFVERIAAAGYGFDASFQARLRQGLEDAKAIDERTQRPGTLADLERDVTARHVEAVTRFAAETKLDLRDVSVVGFHGQTVLHRPDDALTVQLGDGRMLAERLGIDTVYDMRARDMAAGGQGAPLIPAYHAALAGQLPADRTKGPVVFVNIGGISNITYIDGQSDPIAFDTGPGNALIDQWVLREAGIPFDQNGAVASEGGILPALADSYFAAAFFAKPAPKSLDRSDFPVPPSGAGSLEDVARTLCQVAARSVLRAADHLPATPRLWIVGGGGRKHPAIMADLTEGARSHGADVLAAEDAGFDGDALEAEAWAYLAVRSRLGLPLTWPSTTGCRVPVSGGILAWAGFTSGASA